MSNYLAVANVTAALDELLSKTVNSVVSGATVSTLRPDKLQEGATGVNVFLYQVTPNTSWRNVDLPTRGADGQVAQRPLIALDLHYLLSFYGDAGKLEPERLLGAVMTALQTQPQLNRAVIQAAKNNGTRNDNGALLPSDLDQQIELVKFTLLPLNLEELSKLWSVFFQVAYRLSVAYVGTVVLLESAITPNAVLPVREPNIGAGPDQRPVLEKIFSQMNDPSLKDLMVGAQAIIVGGDLFIQGQRLLGVETFLRFDEAELHTGDATLRWELSDTQIILRALPAVTLPKPLRAGSRCIQVVHKSKAPQQSADPPQRIVAVSNGVSFLLRPLLTKDKLEVNHARELVLPVTPKVGPEQNVVLYLNEKPSGNAPPRSYTIPEPQTKRRARSIDAEVLTIPLDKVERGTYLVRLEVAGVTSPLRVEESTGAYVGPVVEVGVAPPVQNVIEVKAQQLSFTRSGNQITVSAKVVIRNKDHQAVSGVQLWAKWQAPNGEHGVGPQTTNASGEVVFNLEGGPGLYVFTIDAAKLRSQGYELDAASVLEQRKEIPPVGLLTMKAGLIRFEIGPASAGKFPIHAFITIEDEDDNPVPNARVKVRWRSAQGATLETPPEGVTDPRGETAFSTNQLPGEYELIVDGVIKENYNFDSTNNSKRISTASRALRAFILKGNWRIEDHDPGRVNDGFVNIHAEIVIRDVTGAAFIDKNVTVSVAWKHPDNTRTFDSDPHTDQLGYATFDLESAERGIYVLEVRNVEIEGYFFDRSNSLEENEEAWLQTKPIDPIYLFIQEISFESAQYDGDQVNFTGRVWLKEMLGNDEADVINALVKAKLFLPGAVEEAQDESSGSGYATFAISGPKDKDYGLQVLSISKPGYLYEKEKNQVEEFYSRVV